MLFRRMALPAPVSTSTPWPLLKAMMLAVSGPAPPTVLFGENVEVAVGVYIRRKHATSTVRGVRNSVGGKVLAAVVLVPGDLVVIGRGKDVGVAVAVHVRCIYAVGISAAAVLMVWAVKFWLPSFSYQATCRRAGRGKDVDVAVAVHVRRIHAIGPVRGSNDGVGGEVLVAVVLVPGDLVVYAGRRRERRCRRRRPRPPHTRSVPRRRGGDMWVVKFWLPSFSYQAILSSRQDAERTSVSPSPSTSAAYTLWASLAAVLMVRAVKFWLPSFSYQAILSSRGRGEDVGVAVAVHVRRIHTLGAERGSGDRVAGEGLAAVVFIPGDLVVVEWMRREHRCRRRRPRPPQIRSCAVAWTLVDTSFGPLKQPQACFRRHDRDRIILDFAVGRHSAHAEVAGGT